MIRGTNPYSISQVFSNDKEFLYTIPKYQRDYSWGKKEWELLFDDIVSNDNGYFLGSIICVNISENSFGEINLELIDGQQRLTSLSILLAALINRIEKHNEELDDEQKNELFNIKKELVIKVENQKKARLTPQIQNNNRDDYFALLTELKLLQNYDKKNNAGNRKIYKAYRYFHQLIDTYLEEKKQESDDYNEIELLFALVKKFNSAIIVDIEVETHKDAYMLFESLNNRGIPLSAIDLIKNLLISTSDKDGKTEDIYNQWSNIVTNYLGDDSSIQERFFRYYYDAYRDELNEGFPTSSKQKYPLGSVATRSNILDIYSELIKKDYKSFLNKLEEKARTYSIILNNTQDELLSVREDLLDLERIQGTPSHILLLYLFNNQKQLDLKELQLSDIVRNITAFFVRRNLTDYPNTRNLAKIFMESIALIKQEKGQEIVNKLKAFLKNCSSSDEEFIGKLRGNIYLDNYDATRFILYKYESKYKTNEIFTDLWKRDSSNKYVWTVEHIFPEGENIPKDWIDMIADGNVELAKQYLEQYTHKLGNLTLTGYNQSLGNMPFDKKKNRKNPQGAYVGYKNGLKLNEDVVDKDKWTVEDIKTRTDKLVEFSLKEFDL